MSNQSRFRAGLVRWLSLHAYGLVTRALFRARTEPAIMRARFERFAHVSRASLQRKHPGVSFDDHKLGTLHVESVCATSEPRAVVIHLHGGAFVFGSAASYRNRAMRLSFRLGAEVFVPSYRLAPEHPYPAALDDALITYQYVRALRPHAPIFLSGDSAGGGLALSLMLRLRELSTPLPNGAIMLSPWLDLSTPESSERTQRSRDRWLTPLHLARWASYYAGATDRRTPLLSPRFAELSGLPPLLILAGEHEILLEEASSVAASAKRAGTDARLWVGPRMQHDWPLTLPWLEESRLAWKAMRAFVDEGCERASARVPGAALSSAGSRAARTASA